MGSKIIEVVERRRRWPVELRLKVLDEVLRPGTSVTAVADRHGVARGLVYQWLRQAREGRMSGLSLEPDAGTRFAPVSLMPEAGGTTKARLAPTSLPQQGEPAQAPAPASRRRGGVVEIRLANGRVMRVDEGIEAHALARLIAVLDGGRS